MRCPTCKKETVVHLQDPKANWLTTCRCVSCGLTFTPVRFTPDEFVMVESQVRAANAEYHKSAQEAFYTHIDQRNREKWAEGQKELNP